MNPEAQYVGEIRLRAGRHLPPDFCGRVMRDARARRRRMQHNRLTVATAALCAILAVAAHLMMTAQTNRKNLQMWSKAAQQITALEETI